MHVIIKLYHFYQDLVIINNGNWTEWSAIWALNNTHDFKMEWAHCASLIWNHKYDFRPKLHNTKFNTTLLHPFWNRPNTGFGQFKYFIDAVLSWFEIKFIHFWGGGNMSLEIKVAKFATWYSLSFIFLQFDWLL